MHTVYLLESEDDPSRHYVGVSDDLKKRLSDHNAGKSKHTAAGRPWRLVPYLALREREKALSFERCLKVGSGHAFARRHF
ncbi:MAG: GIY-YIG nuclease family protein [Opitutus sp.]|nr:GIY-YIG nuclease family protein [Opitutus sp.]